jgi:hypothetical protein
MLKRRTALSTLAAAAILMSLVGCASVPRAPADQDAQAKQFVAPPGLSRLYIYRNEFLGTLVGLDVTVDGRAAGTTKGKTYLIADLPEGTHEIVSKGENTSTLSVQTRAGQPTFVWQEVKMGLLSAGSKLAEVSAETGRAGVMASSLVNSPLMRSTAVQQSSAAAAAVSPAPARPAAAMSANPALPPSSFTFEAERAAKERGCEGPGGVRPQAVLRARQGSIEVFDVQCGAQTIEVRCEMGMCRAAR